MLFGFDALNATATLNTAIPPYAEEYDELKICGDLIVDEIEIRNDELDDLTIFAINAQVAWGLNTQLLAYFENSLDAGNYDTLSQPVTQWRVLRRKYGESIYDVINVLDISEPPRMEDPTVKSYENYEYGLQSVSDGTRGSVLESTSKRLLSEFFPLRLDDLFGRTLQQMFYYEGGIGLAFFGWQLSSIDGLTTYSFDTEVSSSNIVKNRQRVKFEPNSPKPVIYRGLANYNSGSISGIPTRIVDDQLEISPVELLEEIVDFIENGEKKILRNGSGELYYVDTHSSNWKYFDRQTLPTGKQPLQISFSWDEVAPPEGA